MKRTFIKEKLENIDVPVESLSLGDFDYIGEYCAKKNREPGSDLYKKHGCFFRPNYERGILLYSLIKRFEIKSILEIGFGRGYGSFCAAKAMSDLGFDDGKIYTVDPNFNENYLKQLTNIFPKQWFDKLIFLNGTSEQAYSQLPQDIKFDLVYIDGDHRAPAVKADWDFAKERYNKFVLFDDYRLHDDAKDIEVREVVDSLDVDKELIMMDRRIFHDDRCIKDEDLSYGQVLVTNPKLDVDSFVMDWQ